MDRERFLTLGNVLASYSLGDFHVKAPISDELDELDSIISAVNMLGEELKVTTVSRNLLSSVYNAIPEVIMITDANGLIIDTNQSTSKFLNECQIGKNLVELPVDEAGKSIIRIHLKTKKSNDINFDTRLIQANKTIELRCFLTRIENQAESTTTHLLVLRDVSQERETEKIILRAMVSAQEKERSRIAQDLHDAIGSQLSVIKPILSSIVGHVSEEQLHLKQGIDMSLGIVTELMTSVRNTCFDVTPNTLALKGLSFTLKKYRDLIHLSGEIELKLDVVEVQLDEAKGLALFRITQEFVHNTIKHAQATCILLKLREEEGIVTFSIQDDGIGFSVDEGESRIGRGLQSMRTRVELCGGSYQLYSSTNKGTQVNILFP